MSSNQRSLPANASASKLAIVGAGAVGQLIMHQLRAAQLDVCFIAKPCEPSHSVQLQITAINGDKQHSLTKHNVTVLSHNDEKLAQLALVIVCVKAYQVLNAIVPLLDKLSPHCAILLLHNGMGPHLALSPLLGNRTLLLGTTSQGALKLAQWHTQQTGEGLTQLGHFQGPPLPIALSSALTEAIPKSEWVDNIEVALWHKLAINAAINPLTAIHHCQNGALAAAHFNTTIQHVVTELVQVAKLDGITLDHHHLIERIYQVIALTSSNYSSMYQDVAHHRRTEIDQINGYICQRGQAHQWPTPTNQSLWAQINELSRSLS